MEDQRNAVWPVIIAVVLTTLVVGGVMYYVMGGSTTSLTATKQVLPLNASKVLGFNCQQSGGTYGENVCVCPKELVGGEQVSMEYDEDSGYCLTAMGSPAGELGEVDKKLLELKMLKNQ